MGLLLALLPCLQDPLPVRVRYGDRLEFSTEDGTFEGYLSGFVRVHGRTIFDRPDDRTPPLRTIPDSVFLRQARLETGGLYEGRWAYRVQVDFRTNPPGQSDGTLADSTGALLRDGWLEWRASPAFTLRVGQYFAPCTGEEMTSSRFLELADRSPLVRLMPGRELGVEAYGSLFEEALHYFVMVSNGGALVNDQGRSVSDANDEKELSGLVFVRPLAGLRLGLGGSISDQDGVDGSDFDLTTPELSVLWLNSTAGTFDGRRSRIDLSLLAYRGPVSLRGEVLWRRDDLEGSPEGELESGGWFATGSWFLTGETKTPDERVTPANDWGALELGARLCRVRVPNAFEAGLAGAGDSEGVTAYTVAATWWIGRHLRLSVDLIREVYDDPLRFDGRTDRSLTGLLARAQLEF
jgi:phosphate-selective porin